MKLTPRGNPQVVNPQETIRYRNRVGSAIVAQLQANSPKGETGELSRSWRFELTNNGIKIINFSGHAPAVEFGVKGPIRPKQPRSNGKPPALSFFSQGQWWVLQEVAGQPAQLFVERTLQAMFPSSTINRGR